MYIWAANMNHKAPNTNKTLGMIAGAGFIEKTQQTHVNVRMIDDAIAKIKAMPASDVAQNAMYSWDW